jgi:hypothetical protein
MYKPSLPPEDLPPTEVTQTDRMLHQELEQSTSRRFYEACDRITQTLLASCPWYTTTDADWLILVVDCLDIVSYWHIVSNIPQLGNRLQRFANRAKIRVYPPAGRGAPFEISVHEISAYRDWL